MMTAPTPVRHTPVRVAWRWLSGQPLNGRPRTDAGWWTAGQLDWTRTADPAGRWSYRPRAARAAIRTTGTAALVAILAALRLHPVVTLATLAGATLVALVPAGWLSWRAARAWRHHRAYVRPLHRVLVDVLGVPRAIRPREYLTVPVGYARQDGAEVRVSLPPDRHYTADLRRAVVDAVADKLGLAEYTPTWHLVGARPCLVVRPAAHPPERVALADVTELVAAAPDSAPLIGLAAGNRPVAVDLDAEAPHALISMASGAGKSILVRALAAQLLSRGAQVVVLDAKRVSQAWLRSLPGVTYCRTAETAHRALIDLAAEVDRRYDVIDSAPDDAIDSVDVGPRIVLIFEEMNAMIGKLNRYWQHTRAKSDPKTSPALEAFLEIVCMGRAGKVNVIAVAQLGTARTLGGPEVRESFSNRILGRYTVQAWRMLAGEIWPMPRSSSHPGRVQVVLGGGATEVQVAYLSTVEARELAASGPVTVPAGWLHQAPEGVTVTPVTDPAEVAPAAAPEPRYTLAEAAREPWCTLGYAALRQAKSRGRRAGEWPAGRLVDGTERWTRAELAAALANRPHSTDQVDQVDGVAA